MASQPSLDEEQIHLDHLAAIKSEQEDIINLFYAPEVSDPPPMEALLTNSEIMSLFDSGYDVDMILKAYPEFELKFVKQLKRKWSDKNHKKRDKIHDVSIGKLVTKSNDPCNKNKHKQTTRPNQNKSSKRKRRRKSKTKDNCNPNLKSKSPRHLNGNHKHNTNDLMHHPT
eukprot:297987_1